jgi:hypothetical protein
MEKPQDCPICLDKLNESNPLQCGHWVHMSCLKKHFKPECPICRKKLDIIVEGKAPSLYDDYMEQDNLDIQGSVLGVEIIINIGRGILNPVSEIDMDEYNYEDEEIDLEHFNYRHFVNKYKMSSRFSREILNRSFMTDEEDPDYDEDNPHGDEWDYEDI